MEIKDEALPCKFFKDEIGDPPYVLLPTDNNYFDVDLISITHYLEWRYGYYYNNEKISVKLNGNAHMQAHMCNGFYYINYSMIPKMNVYKLKLDIPEKIYEKYIFTLLVNNVEYNIFDKNRLLATSSRVNKYWKIKITPREYPEDEFKSCEGDTLINGITKLPTFINIIIYGNILVDIDEGILSFPHL